MHPCRVGHISRKNSDNTASSEKPSRNRPAWSLGRLRVTSAVKPKAMKAALSFAPAAKASLIRVATLPVARVCCTSGSFVGYVCSVLWSPGRIGFRFHGSRFGRTFSR